MLKKSQYIIWALVMSAFLYGAIRMSSTSLKRMDYIITETKMVESFDPLNADKTVNLPVMRMLYATPLQIDRDNKLISLVLEKFSYDEASKVIKLTAKNGIRFSDGTPLLPKDIYFAILRMARNRPTFPVIKHIKGIEAWSKDPAPYKKVLPGLQIKGEDIFIELTEATSNPLFRFCLELFAIIPESCIDKDSDKVTCERPASSGPFVLSSQTENTLLFSQRKELHFGDNQYEEIRFIYQDLADICQEKKNLSYTDESVLSGNEMSYNLSLCQNSHHPILRKTHWTPAARFGFVLLNPTVAPFEKSSHRLYFTEKLRQYIKTHHPEMVVTRSLFTEILPGFLPFEEKDSSVSKLIADVKEGDFSGKDFIMPEEVSVANSILQKAVASVARELSMNVIHDQKENFVGGKKAVEIASSGFWAQDPTGDLFMFFTKNLHKPLEYVWKDETHYSLLEKIQTEISKGEDFTKTMEEFNHHLIEASLFAPVVHFRRFYSTQESISSFEYPKAITSPAPWQFSMKKALFSL